MNLYKVQKEALEKFLKSGSLVAVLPTGTGKTVVGLKAILELKEKYKENFKALIIVPANLRSNFVQNIQKFSLKLKSEIIVRPEVFDQEYNKNDVLVISYNFMRMYPGIILEKNWTLVITDELHYAKNEKTQNFKILYRIRQKTKHFLGLTASPIANTPQEFFIILSIVANDKNIPKIGMKYISYIEIGGIKQPWWKKLLFGAKDKKGQLIPVEINDIEGFKKLVGKWIYIPKSEKIKEIGTRPEVKSYTVDVELTDFEVRAYKYAMKDIPKDMIDDLKTGTITDAELRKIKNTIMAAQQTLLSPDYIYELKSNNDMDPDVIDISIFRPGSKIKTVGKFLKSTNEKTIVFSTFLKFGAKLANQYFNSIGIKSKEYSGGIKPADRQKIVEEFEKGDLQVICLTGAGQEGLNLPSCKNVFFLTLPWHAEIIRQVIGRALRITSKNEFVKMFWLFATYNKKETIDHWMSNIIKRKSIIRNAIFSVLQEEIDFQEDGMSVAALVAYEFLPKNKKQIIKISYPS